MGTMYTEYLIMYEKIIFRLNIEMWVFKKRLQLFFYNLNIDMIITRI